MCEIGKLFDQPIKKIIQQVILIELRIIHSMQWFVNNSQCQSSCRKISFKLFQRDKSLVDSFKGPAPKFCIFFSFSKLPPLCSPSPLGEAKGGREGGADKNFCLPSDQPTILRIRIRIRNFYFQCSKCFHYYKDRTEDNEEQKSSTQFCKNCEEGLSLFRDLSMSMQCIGRHYFCLSMQNYILFFKNMLFVKRKKETKTKKTKKKLSSLHSLKLGMC